MVGGSASLKPIDGESDYFTFAILMFLLGQFMLRRRAGLFVLILTLLSGCAGSKETDDRPRRTAAQSDAMVIDGPALAASASDVGTVQIYPVDREGSLPLLSIASGNRMSLRFDLIEDRGRPLSVYFYHADRNWRRDLAPAEFLGSFHRDDLLDYQQSAATDVDYYHYHYQFPNESIQFRVSGNYILRVTEQGMEDDVLFERPFFVAEQSVPAELSTEYLLGGGRGFSSTQPFLLFTPPSSASANPNDYSACFIRNGRFDDARCSTRSSLIQAPSVQFYLPPDLSFQPEVADFFLDLGTLQVGGSIERIDFTTSPIRVVMEPDQVAFGSMGLEPLQFAQPVVQSAVRDRANPALGAEYVEVEFNLEPPDGLPYSQDVYVIGAFNNWEAERNSRLEWDSGNRRYVATMLIKQGTYEYTYTSRDQRLRASMNRSAPRPESAYQAFVYYDDIRVGTQRLLTVTGVSAR